MITLTNNNEEIFVNPAQIQYMKRGTNFKTILYFSDGGC